MKEFLIGGLIAIWLIILGVSTLSWTFAILAIAYPIFVLLMFANIMIIHKFIIINRIKHSHRG